MIKWNRTMVVSVRSAISVAHMSAYLSVGQAEGNEFHTGKDGGPPSTGCGRRSELSTLVRKGRVCLHKPPNFREKKIYFLQLSILVPNSFSKSNRGGRRRRRRRQWTVVPRLVGQLGLTASRRPTARGHLAFAHVRKLTVSWLCVRPTSRRWFLKIVQVTMQHDPCDAM